MRLLAIVIVAAVAVGLFIGSTHLWQELTSVETTKQQPLHYDVKALAQAHAQEAMMLAAVAAAILAAFGVFALRNQDAPPANPIAVISMCCIGVSFFLAIGTSVVYNVVTGEPDNPAFRSEGIRIASPPAALWFSITTFAYAGTILMLFLGVVLSIAATRPPVARALAVILLAASGVACLWVSLDALETSVVTSGPRLAQSVLLWLASYGLPLSFLVPTLFVWLLPMAKDEAERRPAQAVTGPLLTIAAVGTVALCSGAAFFFRSTNPAFLDPKELPRSVGLVAAMSLYLAFNFFLTTCILWLIRLPGRYGKRSAKGTT